MTKQELIKLKQRVIFWRTVIFGAIGINAVFASLQFMLGMSAPAYVSQLVLLALINSTCNSVIRIYQLRQELYNNGS